MQIDDLIGIAAGTLTSVSLLPQLAIMIKEKKPTDISLMMLVTLLAGLGLWVWYGVLKADWPVIITNAFSLLINIVILVLRHYYKKAK